MRLYRKNAIQSDKGIVKNKCNPKNKKVFFTACPIVAVNGLVKSTQSKTKLSPVNAPVSGSWNASAIDCTFTYSQNTNQCKTGTTKITVKKIAPSRLKVDFFLLLFGAGICGTVIVSTFSDTAIFLTKLFIFYNALRIFSYKGFRFVQKTPLTALKNILIVDIILT